MADRKFVLFGCFVSLMILGCLAFQDSKDNLIISSKPIVTRVEAGAPVLFKVALKNNASYPLKDISVYIKRFNAVEEIETLEAGEFTFILFTGKSPEEEGNFSINVTARYKDKSDIKEVYTKFSIYAWLPDLSVAYKLLNSSEEERTLVIKVQNMGADIVTGLNVKVKSFEDGPVMPESTNIEKLDPKNTCRCPEMGNDIKNVKFNLKGKTDRLEIVLSNRYGTIIHRETLNLR